MEISLIHGTIGSNIYILFDGHETILIDSSFDTDYKFILDELLFYFKNEINLTKIILTHYHKDHSGGAKILSEKFGAKIYISHEDSKIFSKLEDYITLPRKISEGTRKFLNSSNMWEKCFSTSSEWFPKIDGIINNEDKIMGIKIIIFFKENITIKFL